MKEAAQSLARRVMASRHLRWMDGMQRVHPDCPEDAWRLVRSVWRPYSPTGDRGVAPAYFDATILDLTDPATAGCISAMALERWECELFAVGVHDDGQLRITPLRNDPAAPFGEPIAFRAIEGLPLWIQAPAEALCWEDTP